MPPLARLGPSLLPCLLAACALSPEEDTALAEEALVDGPPRAAVVRCELDVVPECGRKGLLGDACGEGHDALYTAYDVDDDGEGHREVVHHTCLRGRPCPLTPVTANVTRTLVAPESARGGTWRARASVRVADDDGCAIACDEHGDALCCAGLATRVAPRYRWADVTRVTLDVTCERAGCRVAAAATNRGAGPNQLAGLRCGVSPAR